MAEAMQGGDAQVALAAAGSNPMSGMLEEPDHSSSNWYFSREDIETNSPSRKDGIDLRKETYFRKSYCTFLQDLGIRLKVPQVTIATAIVFSHRFFLRQSHAKNDRYMVATICMFIAGKVEETPRPLRDVIWLSYENRFKKDPAAVQRIKQKDVYETEKERVLLGERLVLTTLGFDLNIHHPYKPLVAAIKRFKVAAGTLAQVAWNFVNDGLRTSLCLQFKPHHIAAGAIFLAAKFLKVKLPSEVDKAWWQEFEVNPRQLEEVSNQMLELYEQNKSATGSRMSDPSSSAGPYNRLKAMAASQAAAERAPGTSDYLSAPARLPAHVKTEHQQVMKSSLVVETQVGTGEVTEAQSSLEDGEDMADSKPLPIAVRKLSTTTTTTTTTTEVTRKTLVSVNEVESSGHRVTDSNVAVTEKPYKSPAYMSTDEIMMSNPSAADKRRHEEEDLCESEAVGEAEKASEHMRQERKEGFSHKVQHNSGAVQDVIEEGELSVASVKVTTVKEGGQINIIHKLEDDLPDLTKKEDHMGRDVGKVDRRDEESKLSDIVEHEQSCVKPKHLHGDLMPELNKLNSESREIDRVLEPTIPESERERGDGCSSGFDQAKGEKWESSTIVSNKSETVGDNEENGNKTVKKEEQETVNGSEKGDINMKMPVVSGPDAVDVKRDRTDDSEAGAAAKRKRGFSSADGSGIDRKKIKEQGEWADASGVGRSPGPVEEGEVLSANQALDASLSPPRLGDKRPHASVAVPNRGITSPESQRRNNVSRWEQNGVGSQQNGHRDGRNGVHRDHSHHHSSSFQPSHPSYRPTSYQHRPEGEREWRYHGDREYVETDHKKMRHEHVH